MALRSEHLEVANWGKEVTPGTAVAATKILPDVRLGLEPEGDASTEYMASGELYGYSVSSGAEWSVGNYDMPFCFNQWIYVADSAYGISTPVGAGVAKTRVHTPPTNTSPNRQFYTWQHGQSGSVTQHTHGHINGVNYTITKRGEGGRITGDIAAQEPEYATSVTGTPTTVTPLVADKMRFDVYSATSWANLTSSPTLVTDLFQIQFSNGPLLGTVFFIGSANRSFDAAGTIVPNSSVTLIFPFDVSGSDIAGLLNMAGKRAGTTFYLSVRVIGPEVETGVNASWRHDMALKVVNVPKKASMNNVFRGKSWPCKLFKDVASGKAHEFTTVNNLAST
jgi:hypothetical protein